jgi:hypothetical protein
MRYEGLLSEEKSVITVLPIVTYVSVEQITYRSHPRLRKDVQMVLEHMDIHGRPLMSASYRLQSDAGRITHLMIRESVGAVGLAIARNEKTFAGGLVWSDATGYDADRLFEEVSRLRSLQPYEVDTDIMI